MAKFVVLINNGLAYEYHSLLEADTVSKARKAFKYKHAGTWYVDDFKVRKQA